LDTTTLAGRLVILRVSLAYRGHAVPLAWQVYERKSVSLPFKAYQELLEHTCTLLPAGAQVVLLGDRGFRTRQLMRWCRRPAVGWHFRLRLKADQLVVLADGRMRALRELGLQRGRKGYLHGVRLGRQGYGPLDLALAWIDEPNSEPWYIASDEPTDDETLAEYRLRGEIEHEFRDDKSGGFQLEDSQLPDGESVSRLILVLSVACLHLVSLGTLVVEAGQRQRVDAHWTRGLSYFQIGWRWLRRALYLEEAVGALFRLGSGDDPAPVTLSRKRRHRPLWTDWSADLIPA
jgi:Transposase DDE domain